MEKRGSFDIGSFLNKKNEPQKKIREFLSNNNCLHIEPEEDSFDNFFKNESRRRGNNS